MRQYITHFFLMVFCMLFMTASVIAAENLDKATGLIFDKGFETVKKNCTVCHSAKLITQNRMERQGWLDTIRWMQKTQGLRQFKPETEKEILDYLSKHYAPRETFRRPPLSVQWE